VSISVVLIRRTNEREFTSSQFCNTY